MTEGSMVTGTPLVLVVNDEEWSTRSIESILKPKGYAVLMAYTGRQGLQLASKIRPDLILIDLQLPDVTGIDLCERMRRLPTVRPSTPILLSTSGPVSRRDRLEAFRAGVWDILYPPLYPKELLARFDAFIGAKRDADEALEQSYLDPLTGFYNIQGLMRRVTEMSAETSRSKRPLACVVIGSSRPELAVTMDDEPFQLEEGPAGDGAGGSTRTLASLIVSATRLSDVVGRVGEEDFVIVAPGTDQEGAIRLAERIMSAVDKGASEHEELGTLKLKAGFYASSGAEQIAGPRTRFEPLRGARPRPMEMAREFCRSR
jgi:PleD family two-component response regulator